MGPPHCRQVVAPCQDAAPTCVPRRHHPRCRRCLLKGCERWFLPTRPQARYCSPGCQQAARRWRRWHASQRYRASAHGKQRRRDQSRRYRVRVHQRPAAPAAAALTSEPEAATAATPPLPGEGQRPATFFEVNAGQPCQRPGCYTCFAPTARSPQQRFCGPACRQALRRVRQREAQRCQRRRRGARPRRCHLRPPP